MITCWGKHMPVPPPPLPMPTSYHSLHISVPNLTVLLLWVNRHTDSHYPQRINTMYVPMPFTCLCIISSVSVWIHPTKHSTLNEGPRTRVDQPQIKYWKSHELCKNAIKCIHTIWGCGQKYFKFLNIQQLLKCILRVFPYLGGAGAN